MRYIAVIIFCTLFATWQYTIVTIADCPDCNLRMRQIAQGRDQAPFAYRILTPLIVMAMGNSAHALVVFHMVMFAVFFCLLWQWAKRWLVAPVPVLFATAIMIVIVMPTYYFSAYAVMEWNLWLGGLLLMPRWSLSGL